MLEDNEFREYEEQMANRNYFDMIANIWLSGRHALNVTISGYSSKKTKSPLGWLAGGFFFDGKPVCLKPVWEKKFV